jgi:alpha-tubulin suppressor-like RCC1 family protein/endonuclease/exonuclease/phosphatase family metal-dependent hydrolase
VAAGCSVLLALGLWVPSSATAGTRAQSSPAVAAASATPGTISTGGQTSCEVRADQTAWCWGRNDFGQVGNGLRGITREPAQVLGTGWATISTGGSATCATKVDQTLWCWGLNHFGQLGIGSTKMSVVPAQVRGEGWTSVSMGWFHGCATKSDGRLHCWGLNNRGQLGLGAASKPKPNPVRVGVDSNWRSVSVAGWRTCGLRTDNTAWCFGDNAFGQAGQAAGGNRPAPTKVGRLTDWAELDLAWGHTCGLRANGEALCFGLNNTGQLGDGTLQDRSVPTPVATAGPFVDLTVTDAGACALRADGSAWCWGADRYDELRLDATSPSPSPARSAASGIVSLDGAWMHMCGQRGDGGVSCWGSNEVSQLGLPATPAPARRSGPAAGAEGRVGEAERYLPAPSAARLERRSPSSIASAAVAGRPPVEPQHTGPLSFRYSTFNLLGSQHTSPTGMRRDWAPGRLRTEWAGTMLERLAVGLVGFQEIQPDQIDSIGLATGRAWRFYPGTKLGYPGAPQSVAWRRSVWKPVWKTTVAMPFMRGWRPQALVRLRHRATGHDVYLLNAHFSPGKMESDRDKAKKITVKVLEKLQRDGLPVLLTGDFNERTELFCAVVGKTRLKAAMGGRSTKKGCSPPPGARVDWMFGSGGRFTEFLVLQDEQIRRITDHSVHSARLTVG